MSPARALDPDTAGGAPWAEAGAPADAPTGGDKPTAPRRRTRTARSSGPKTSDAAGPVVISKPRIGDTRPARAASTEQASADTVATVPTPGRRRASGGSRTEPVGGAPQGSGPALAADPEEVPKGAGGRSRRGKGPGGPDPGLVIADPESDAFDRRRGRERKGRPLGRYLMCVQVRPDVTQIAVLEGRSLVSHFVSRPADDSTGIHGNVYVGRVQNVLPGMEAAFVDIGTTKNAVLYASDLKLSDPVAGRTDSARAANLADLGAEMDEGSPIPSRRGAEGHPRIEDVLRPGQNVLCQVTKNPIGTKGARLTQEVSLAGRFVVLVPGASTCGISKRLDDTERKRLRRLLENIRPEGQGLIVRTAAEGATAEELSRDVARLLRQWADIERSAARIRSPALVYAEPTLAVRVIREEFSREYRSVLIDDPRLYEEVHDYVSALIPELASRVELYQDPDLGLFERNHVHEQLFKALDRKVWLPSGGSLIIERTEALTVIDVNTGRNVGTSNLEETVFDNNLEAAEEVARQLRLRDIGGIIVIDFIDMEVRRHRDEVLKALREALGRDKTRTQVLEISELGLVQMTRKRVSEGLVESFSATCPTCSGRGIVLDGSLL
ncbi:MAG: Rne/Rng family ribonuclease [Acidimicrobiales bacterium]